MHPYWTQLCMLAGAYRGYVDGELYQNQSMRTGYFEVIKNSDCSQLTFVYGSAINNEVGYTLSYEPPIVRQSISTNTLSFDNGFTWGNVDCYDDFNGHCTASITSYKDCGSFYKWLLGKTCKGTLFQFKFFKNNLTNVRVQTYNYGSTQLAGTTQKYYRMGHDLLYFVEIYDMENGRPQKYSIKNNLKNSIYEEIGIKTDWNF